MLYTYLLCQDLIEFPMFNKKVKDHRKIGGLFCLFPTKKGVVRFAVGMYGDEYRGFRPLQKGCSTFRLLTDHNEFIGFRPLQKGCSTFPLTAQSKKGNNIIIWSFC